MSGDGAWSFGALAEAIKDPVVVWSCLRDDAGDVVDFVYEYVNEAAARTIGQSASGLIGQRLLVVLPAHRELGLFERYREVAITGLPAVIEIPWFEDGNVSGAFEASVSVMGDGIVSVARDVTARVVAEQRMQISESRYRTLLGELPIPVWINGPNGVVVANDAAAALFGVADPADLIGLRQYQFLAAESFDPGDRISHYAEHGEAMQEFEVVADLPVGRRNMQLFRRVIPFEGDLVAMWAATDVTDRVRAERELAEAAELHRFLAENSSELVLRVSDTGVIVYASDASGGLLELAAQDLVGAHLTTVVHPNARVLIESMLETARDTGAPQEVDLQIATAAHGGFTWVNVSATSVLGAVDVEFHVAIRDIRARRAAEQAMAEAEATQRLILESLTEGVVLHSPHVGVVRANRAATEMVGILPGAGTLVEQIPRQVEAFEEDGSPIDLSDTPGLRALRSGNAERGRILQYRYLDGSVRWMQIDAVAVDSLGSGDDPSATDSVMILQTFIDITAAKESQLALAESEERLRLVIENTRELITVVDMGGTIRYVSPSAVQILGHRPEAAIGANIADYIHADDFDRVLDEVLARGVRQEIRNRAWHADGTGRSLETLASLIHDTNGRPMAIQLSSRDITDRLEIERRLSRERRLLEATFDSLHAGVLAVDGRGRVIEANGAFCDLIGATVELGTNVLDLIEIYTMVDVDGSELDTLDRPLAAALDGRSTTDTPLRLIRASGQTFDVLASASPVHAVDGEANAAVLTIHDVTALRAAEADLRRLATVDMLTGLPNRRYLVHHLAAAIDRNRRSSERLAVLFLDLDGFKAINDNFGHEAGDELLAAAARRIADNLRPGDTVARYGGDEFVIVVENLDHPEDAEHLAARVEHALAQPFELSAGTAHIGGSVGIARLHDADTADNVLADADRAMYRRKHERKSRTTQTA